MAHDYDELEAMGATYNPAIGISCRNESDRTRKVVSGLRSGYGPTCIRFLVENVPKKDAGAVLDFGCGVGGTTGAVHVRALRSLGYECDGYEWEPDEDDNGGRSKTFWKLEEEGVIRTDALDYVWDTVIANNVLNVHEFEDELEETMTEIKTCMDDGTLLLINLPKEPRYFQSTGRDGEIETEDLLDDHFGHVVEVEPGLWACYRPRSR